MTLEEAKTILNNTATAQKVANGGIAPLGKLTADEWNAVVVVVNSIRKLGGLENVTLSANSQAQNSYVLYLAAGSTEWTIKPESELSMTVDTTPTEGSGNPVSSNGVFVRINAILEMLGNVAYVGEEDDEVGIYTAGGQEVELDDYATKVFVQNGFVAKVSGKGLSSNDYTSEEKQKLASLDPNAQGGGSAVITFNITIISSDATNRTFNWGTIKFSDIVYAASHYDIVRIYDGAFVYTLEIFERNNPTMFVFVTWLGNNYSGITISEGSNDAIESVYFVYMIPENLYDLQDDSSHRTVTDTEKAKWNRKVTTFTATTVQSQGSYSYDFGTTKFSEVVYATQHSEEVILDIDGGKLRYHMTYNNALVFGSAVYLGNAAFGTFALVEGENDSISVVESSFIVPSALRDLSDDSNHRTVTDTEKNAWNAKAKVKTFNVTISDSSSSDDDDGYNFDWGTTKFSDIASAVSNYDEVQIIVNSGFGVLKYGGHVGTTYVFFCVMFVFNPNITNVIISEGSNDSIVTTYKSRELGEMPVYALGQEMGGAAYRTASIPSGQVDSTSTSTAFTATIPGITELRDGVCMLLKNGVITSAAGFTINVNGLGAKPSYSNMAAATADTTIFNVNYTMLFVYDSTRVSGGCWVCYRGYNSNDNTIGYNLRTNSSSLPMSEKVYRYRILFTSADGTKWVPANTSSSTNATSSRSVNQTKIDPHGSIVYYSTTTAVNADSQPGATYLWEQYALTLGYSFNRTGAALVLSYPKPVYIKCAPQSDGSAIIDSDTPYVQALPTTADGKIYIYLGRAYSATAIELMLNHPVYHYYNGAIRLWTGPV